MSGDEWELPAPGQATAFGDDADFHATRSHWEGMPEFIMEDQQPDSEVVVKFRSPEDRRAFAELVGQPIERWRSGAGIWFPPIEIGHYKDKRYRDASEDQI